MRTITIIADMPNVLAGDAMDGGRGRSVQVISVGIVGK
jgi:hypothetical protein